MKSFYDGYDETDSCLTDLPRPRDFCAAFCPCLVRMCCDKKKPAEKVRVSADGSTRALTTDTDDRL